MEYGTRLRACLESLTDEQVWWRPNEASNSIGNLLLHLNGNVGQWLVGSFNPTEDRLDRAAEFAERHRLSRDVLLDRLGATLQEASAVLSRLTEADLLKTLHIQGLHGQRCRSGLPRGRAFRHALRSDSVHHQTRARRGSGVLQPVGQDRPAATGICFRKDDAVRRSRQPCNSLMTNYSAVCTRFRKHVARVAILGLRRLRQVDIPRGERLGG